MINYDQKKKDTVVCLLGAQFWRLRPEKKDTVVSLAGARSIMTGKKKDTVVCLLGARFWRLRPEKKKIQSSVWRVVLYVVSVFGSDGELAVYLARCAVVSVFGSGGKLAVFLLWRESFIMTGKKDTVVCLAGARSLLRPEKKTYSRLSGGCAIMSVFLVAIVIFCISST